MAGLTPPEHKNMLHSLKKKHFQPHNLSPTMTWHYAIHNERNGPVSEEELTTLVQNGTLNRDTLVWREGMPDWQPISLARADLLTGEAQGENVPVVSGVALAGSDKDLAVQRMRQGYGATTHVANYAGFWIRLAAKIIDGIIMAIVMLPISMAMPLLFGLSEKPNPAVVLPFMGISFIIQTAIPFLYNGFMIGKYGATLGKKAMGLKVVTDDMHTVSMGRAFGRAGAEIISGMILYIGYIMVAFDVEKRALHDHIASTRVIFTR